MQGELTRVFIVVVVIGLIFWDIAVAVLLGPEATVSRVLLDWSREHPVIPFMFGIVVGHIFWPNNGGER